MRFSERYGYTPTRSVIQREDMDEALRNGLWSVLASLVFRTRHPRMNAVENDVLRNISVKLWRDYFKAPVDTIPAGSKDTISSVRLYFFNASWNEVYDLLEFVAAAHVASSVSNAIRRDANAILERERSAYRFVGDQIAELTAPEEIEAIEGAIAAAPNHPGVAEHIQTALHLLSDRKTPDYRNSIKESISAVEAVANAAAGVSGATLGDALNKLGFPLHGALGGAFNKLYGYTSDAQGIRHALMDEPTLEFEDAKFMAVVCSAAVNFVVAKASRAGVRL